MKKCRSHVVDIGRKLFEHQVVYDGQGNISCRLPEQDLVAVTPSAVPYLDREPEDICIVDMQSKLIEGKWKPSSEIRLHMVFYRQRPEVKAVIHTHALYCSIYGISGEKELPLVLNEAAMVLGQPVPVAPYARPGTRDLARSTYQATGNDGRAVIMAHHGLVTVGESLEDAYAATLAAEHTAQAVCTVRSMGVEPKTLAGEEIQELRRLYASYGPEPTPSIQDTA